MTIPKNLRLALAALPFLLFIHGRAMADSSAACLQTIREVCTGQEDHLETCLAQHGDRLTPDCRDLLQNAITQAQNGTGAGACLDDIKTFCAGVDATSLTQCLTTNYAQFSPACQKSLNTSGAVSH